MSLYVIKFGGTSVASVDRVQHAAELVKKFAIAGHSVAVVVSAMAGMTNQLLSYANSVSPQRNTLEHDVVAASGEQITAGLMALALKKTGLQARSYLASQIPIETDNKASEACIKHIETKALNKCIKNNIIPVVAGFQGITYDTTNSNEDDILNFHITTLGRGGSDTTAVALAAALKADRCYIYTDVEGVFTSDPRVVHNVKKIDRLSAPEMLELAAKGAKVLHARCVELAMRHDVELCVLSSFVEGFGTIITNTKILEDQTQVENPKLSAIAHSLDDVIITYGDITEKPRDIQNRRLKTLLESLSQYQVSLSFMSYTPNQPFFFVIKKPDLERIRAILENLKTELSFDSLAINPNIVTLSLVGIGINRDSNLLPLVFETLSTHEIPILMMNTQEIKISLIIDYNHMTRALNALHQALFHDLLQDA